MRMIWWIHNVHLFFPIITVDMISTRKRRIVWSKCFFSILSIYLESDQEKNKQLPMLHESLIIVFLFLATSNDWVTDDMIMKWNEFSTMFIDSKVEVKMNMIICKLAKHSVKFFLIRHLYINVQVEKRGRITISWFPKKDFPLRSSCQSLVNNFWYYCITKESNNHKTKCYLPHFRLGQISTPTFYPRETRYVWSKIYCFQQLLWLNIKPSTKRY